MVAEKLDEISLSLSLCVKKDNRRAGLAVSARELFGIIRLWLWLWGRIVMRCMEVALPMT